MAAVKAVSAPGVWLRAGQAGQVVGLDWPAVLALLPAAYQPGGAGDRERIIACLRAYEEGMLKGAAEQAAAEAERRKQES